MGDAAAAVAEMLTLTLTLTLTQPEPEPNPNPNPNLTEPRALTGGGDAAPTRRSPPWTSTNALRARRTALMAALR